MNENSEADDQQNARARQCDTSKQVEPECSLGPVEVNQLTDPRSSSNAAGKQKRDTEDEILDRVKVGERWMIWLTALIFVTSALQVYLGWSNNRSSSQQTDQLISAARISAYAADQNAQAARNFAGSANEISKGVGDAVDRLNIQANAARSMADSTAGQLEAYRAATNDSVRAQIARDLPVIEFPGNSLHIASGLDGSRIIVLSQRFKNLGQTRAIGPVVDLGWGDRIPSRNTRYQFTSTIWEKGTWLPNGERQADFPVSPSQAQDILRAKPLYVYGRVRYNDIYPVSVVHKRNDHLIEFHIQIVRVAINLPTSIEWSGMDVPDSYCYDYKCGEDYK